jgi:hypothetical protein
MNYKEIEVEALNGGKEKHIIIENEDGSFKSFPVDLNNPEYQAWLNPEAEQSTPSVIDEA